MQEYRRTLVGLGGSILAKIDAYIFEIRNVLRRKSTSIEEMQDIELQVEEYGDEIALSQGSITGVEKTALTDTVTVADGRSVRHIESQIKDTLKKPDTQKTFNPYRIKDLWNRIPTL